MADMSAPALWESLANSIFGLSLRRRTESSSLGPASLRHGSNAESSSLGWTHWQTANPPPSPVCHHFRRAPSSDGAPFFALLPRPFDEPLSVLRMARLPTPRLSDSAGPPITTLERLRPTSSPAALATVETSVTALRPRSSPRARPFHMPQRSIPTSVSAGGNRATSSRLIRAGTPLVHLARARSSRLCALPLRANVTCGVHTPGR